MRTINYVYSGSFRLADSSAGDIREIISSWLTQKTSFDYKGKIRDGTPFAYEAEDFSIEAFEIPIDNDGNRFWMMQYSHPCSETKTRRWYTEIGISFNVENKIDIIGFRLFAKDPTGNMIGILRSTPNVLHMIAQKHRLVADGRDLLGENDLNIIKSNDHNHLDKKYEDLLSLLGKHERSMPVVLIVSNGEEQGVDYSAIFKRTLGKAHVFFMDHKIAKLFDESISEQVRKANNTISIFYSDFDINDPETYQNSISFRCQFDKRGCLLRRQLEAIHDVYMSSEHPEKVLPSFTQVRIWALEKLAKFDHREGSANDEDRKKKLQQELALEDLEVALSLAAEMETKNRILQQELNLAQHNLEKKRQLESNGVFPPFPQVNDWLTAQFTGVAIASRAVKELCDPKYNVYSKSEEIYKALVALGIYRTVASQDEQIARRLFDERLKELGLKDTFSTTATSRGVYGAEYAVIHEGEKIVLDRHIVGSSSRDPRYCLRIYYGYAGNGTLVIGSAPRHLTTGFS